MQNELKFFLPRLSGNGGDFEYDCDGHEII